MKTAVFFAGKYGTSERVAIYFRRLLGVQTDIFDLSKPGTPDFSKYDCIIVGGSVYMGSVQKKVKKFCETYKYELVGKNLGLFLCGLNKVGFDKVFEESFPKLLRDRASSSRFLGGELDFTKLNFIEKLIIRKVTGIKESISQIDYRAIQDMADELSLASLALQINFK